MFLAFRAEVEAAVAEALAALDLPTDDLGIEDPPEDVDAVLASSAAFRLAGEVGAPPPQVAADLAAEIDPEPYGYLDTARAQGPYVNFTPTDAYYRDTVRNAGEDWGRLEPKGESVVVEHTSANPTGPVHMGRARNPIVGDAVARILETAGYDVDVHYYVNDAGRQMAVFTWAYETFDESDLPPPERDRADYDLVRYYRKGNEFLEEGPEEAVADAEAEIEAIMQGLEAGEEATYERVHEVVEAVLGGMRTSLERLPATFDEFVHETRFMRTPAAGGAAPEGGFRADGAQTWTEDVVERLRGLDEAVYEEGAWQLDLSQHGIEKKLVFLRSDGTSLYPTRDIAHHEWKLEHYDRAVSVFGEDHELQARQVRRALTLLGNDTDRIRNILHSWVNLAGGEGMSTRAGTGIDLDDLLDEAETRARAEVEKRLDTRTRGDLDEADIDRIAEQVGVGAVRYDIVAKQPSKAITFDWEEALDFEAQSAPYVQYAHARCCGILEEADADVEVEAADADTDADAAADVDMDVDVDALDAPEERALVREIARFPAVIEGAAEELEPHRVATYCRAFADAFNTFYRECPVLDAPRDLRRARLALVAAARDTLANALGVLGIAAPESM